MSKADQLRPNKLKMILFLIYSVALFIYSFHLFSTNGNGGIPFMILMISCTIFFGSLRMRELKMRPNHLDRPQ